MCEVRHHWNRICGLQEGWFLARGHTGANRPPCPVQQTPSSLVGTSLPETLEDGHASRKPFNKCHHGHDHAQLEHHRAQDRSCLRGLKVGSSSGPASLTTDLPCFQLNVSQPGCAAQIARFASINGWSCVGPVRPHSGDSLTVHCNGSALHQIHSRHLPKPSESTLALQSFRNALKGPSKMPSRTKLGMPPLDFTDHRHTPPAHTLHPLTTSVQGRPEGLSTAH